MQHNYKLDGPKVVALKSPRAVTFCILIATLAVRARAQFANADLELATHATSPAFATVPITFTVVVKNLGPDYVTGVEVNNQVPEGSAVSLATVVHSDGREFPGGCFVGTVGSLAGSVSCSVGSIDVNQFATITIVFTAPEGHQTVHSWTFAGLNNETNLANNDVETTLQVLPAAAIPVASAFLLMLLGLALAIVGWVRTAV